MFKSSSHLKGISENFSKNFAAMSNTLTKFSSDHEERQEEDDEDDDDEEEKEEEELKPSSTPRSRFGNPFWQHMYGGPLPNLDPSKPALNLGEDASLVEV